METYTEQEIRAYILDTWPWWERWKVFGEYLLAPQANKARELFQTILDITITPYNSTYCYNGTDLTQYDNDNRVAALFALIVDSIIPTEDLAHIASNAFVCTQIEHNNNNTYTITEI